MILGGWPADLCKSLSASLFRGRWLQRPRDAGFLIKVQAVQVELNILLSGRWS